jgi:hypothetical protein
MPPAPYVGYLDQPWPTNPIKAHGISQSKPYESLPSTQNAAVIDTLDTLHPAFLPFEARLFVPYPKLILMMYLIGLRKSTRDAAWPSARTASRFQKLKSIRQKGRAKGNTIPIPDGHHSAMSIPRTRPCVVKKNVGIQIPF